MTEYTMRITTGRPYDDTVQAVRDQLGEAGFGILTEIDLKSTLKQKLDVDVEPQIILGACRPQLAHEALKADPSVAALLPCNVVVRTGEDGDTVVEAFDPAALVSLGDQASDAVRAVADDARERLQGALAALAEPGTVDGDQ